MNDPSRCGGRDLRINEFDCSFISNEKERKWSMAFRAMVVGFDAFCVHGRENSI
jgi:hypothetical protein